MKFERRQLAETKGSILAHNISDREGKRVLRKGTEIGDDELEALKGLGREFIYVAELEQGDVSEAEAARKTAELIRGDHIRLVGAVTGRTNMLAEKPGVLRIDIDRLTALNRLPGVTLATLRDRSVVPERQMVASIKIIPYAITAETMRAIESIAVPGSIVSLVALQPRRVHIMFLGGAAILDKLESDFRAALEARIVALGSSVEGIHRVATDMDHPESEISSALVDLPTEEIDLLIMAGETAVMDPRDVIPSAIKRAGGSVEITGAPVDPGNLLMIAYLDDVPVLSAPGCARSSKENVVDWVLPSLLSGERVEQEDITSLGHGGLLEDIKERPFPRSAVGGNSDA